MISRPKLAFWLCFYALLIALPLLLMLLPPLPPARSFWVEFSVALGFAGLAIMGVQFILTARFKGLSTLVGMDSMLQFHRQMGLVAFVFVLAHPLVIILYDQAYISFLDPRVNAPRAVFLNLSLIALFLVVILPFVRKLLGMSYQWWRLTHGAFAAIVLFVGLSHIIMVGHYVSTLWKQGLWVVLIGTSLLLLGHTRILKPFLATRRPWEVEKNTEEKPDVWTLTLVPKGHNGLHFLPGQCVWLTLGSSPFSLEQHPFTIASSAESNRKLEITIKALGDYTASTGEIHAGTEAWLEGPYGKFTYDPETTGPLVFISGGIGITPAMSMLRTIKDRGDRRQLVLIYASVRRDNILFEEELLELENCLQLHVIHILDEPAEDFVYEKGPINEAVLTACLTKVPAMANARFFICGPDAMMNIVELALLKLGVSSAHIASERFNIV